MEPPNPRCPHRCSALSESQLAAVIRAHHDGATHPELRTRFGICHEALAAILTGFSPPCTWGGCPEDDAATYRVETGEMVI